MYKEYSRFYDDVYEGKRLDELAGLWRDDRDFWLNQAKEAGSPILEIACDSGRLTIPIAELGLIVHGIDNSQEMLALLKEKVARMEVNPENLTYELSSMSGDDEYPSGFNLAFVSTSALQYLHIAEDQEKAFAKAYGSLKSGGKFITDVFNPNPEFITGWGEKILMKQSQSLSDPDTEIDWYCVPISYDGQTKILNMPNLFVFRRQDEQTELSMDVGYYCYSESELKELFLKSDFKDIKVFGGYNKEDFTQISSRIIMMGTK